MDQQLVKHAAVQFEGLPISCGATSPGLVVVDEWHVWSSQPSTEDQLRIERYLDGFAMRGKRILHIGAGNSLLAKRFCARGAHVLGTTITADELAHGHELAIPGYEMRLHNKYSGAQDFAWGRFDFIVDNNPTTFACCLHHYMAMLRFYADVLAPQGQWLVDRVGLAWLVSQKVMPSRWSFSADDLARSVALVGLQVTSVTPDILAVSAMPPARSSASRRLLSRAIARIGRSRTGGTAAGESV